MQKFLRIYREHPQKAALFAALAGSMAALMVAWISQYGFGLRPCELCMLQRYPYMALAFVAGASLYLRKQRHAALIVCCVLLCAETGIAVYHAGVEKALFTGPTACTGGGESGQSIEDLRAQILHSEVVACNQPAIEVMGITMAGANAIYAGLLTIFCIAAYRKKESLNAAE